MKSNVLLFFLLLILPMTIMAAPIKVHDIHVQEEKDVTHVSFLLTQPVKWNIFSLMHPKRIIIDFENTRLSLNLQKIPYLKNHMVSIRDGYPKPGILRIVLDVRENIDYKVNAKQWVKKINIDLFSHSCHPPKDCHSRRSLSPNALIGDGNDRIVNTKKTMIVVIDPGHGGRDPGAVGRYGTREKDVVLSIARMLANRVNEQPNMRAVLTRDGDYFVSLRKRLQIARRSKADLFIAIHADSYFNDRAAGASVYSLSHHGATSLAARWLAQRENHSELGGVDLDGLEDQSVILRSVLLDLAQTATKQASVRCGASLLDALSEVTKLHYSRVEQAPFMVLKSPDIPSILVETGFISNSKEENRLRDKKHQYKMALAIFEGIHDFQTKYVAKEV